MAIETVTVCPLGSSCETVVDGKIHKLGRVFFDYVSGDYQKPWRFRDSSERIDLSFTPFTERLAQTDLKLIYSEVHQMFGKYSGRVISDDGEEIIIKDLIGFAEEHQARW